MRRPAQQDYAGAQVGVELDEELTRKLKELSQRHGVTLYMTLLAGWAALLGRLSGQEEVVVGTSGGEPGAERDRRTDRIFCEHAGVAGGPEWAADGGGATGESEGEDVRGTEPSGAAV